MGTIVRLVIPKYRLDFSQLSPALPCPQAVGPKGWRQGQRVLKNTKSAARDKIKIRIKF